MSFFDRCIDFSLRNKPWVLGFTALLISWCAWSVSGLPVDAVPDITNTQVVINTKTNALDPEKTEILITRPIENEMAGIPGLEEVRSISKYGLSQITLVFSESTDVYWARQQVLEFLQNTKKFMPEGIHPEIAPMTTGLGEVFMYSVEAKPGSPLANLPQEERLTELRSIQDFIIRPYLRRIHGVADVDSNGGFVKEIHVNFFTDKLQRYGISVEQLASRLDTLGENYAGGYIQNQGQQVIVRTSPGFTTLKQLEDLPLGLDANWKDIHLHHIAQLRPDHALRIGAATRNGQETVLGTVLMRVGANGRQVAHDSSEAIAHISLPEGVVVIPLYSRSFLVDATLKTVLKNLTEGAALVVLVLLLMLGNVRASLIVAATLPICMLFAIRGMISAKISGNLMSLGAIDFGLLVDGSIVLIENILTRLQAHPQLSPSERSSVIQKACAEVIRPIVFGLCMIMLVYLPILSLEQIEGRMFRPMAFTVLLALLASLAIAVWVMPILADLWVRTKAGREPHETWLFRRLKSIYRPLLESALRHPRTCLSTALLLLVAAAFVFRTLGANFIPKLDEGDLVLGLARDSKISLSGSVETQLAVEKLIASYPEVQSVFSRIGTPESATDPMGVNLADTFVILKKDHPGSRLSDRFAKKEDLEIELRSKLAALYPDQESSTTQPIEMRFNEILEGSRADVTLRILGPDLDRLFTLINQAKISLEKTPGVETISFDALTALKKSPVLSILPNYEALSKYRVNLIELNKLVELAMSGKEIGSFIENDRRLPIKIHLDESLRDQMESIKTLPVGHLNGGSLPLSALADFSLEDRVTTIARAWGIRYAAISINLRDRDVESFMREAKAKLAQDLSLPPGFGIYWGGQFKNLEHAKKRLYLIIPLTLLAVLLILLRIFGTWREALIVFTSVPFAGVGGVFALAVRGIPFSVSAGIGFIALIGIALLNSIVLMSFYRKLKSEGRSISDVVRIGSLARLRPVLMTALVASLGFIPMALNTGIGAEVQRPLATVVIGGLLTSTLLTLLLLPTMVQGLDKARS